MAAEAVDSLDERIQQGVFCLAGYAADELLTILQIVLQERSDVLQPLVDWATPDHCYGSARAVIDLRCTGVIKSFSVKSGYGFIASDEITNAFGMDLLVSDKQIRNFTAGEEVDFAILLNKGKPQAFDLVPAKGAETSMKGKGGFSAGNGKGTFGYDAMAETGDGWGWGAAPVKGGWGGASVKGGQQYWRPAGKGVDDYSSHWGAQDLGRSFNKPWGSSTSGSTGVADTGALGSKRHANSAPSSQQEVPGVTDIRWVGTVKSFTEGKFGFLTCEELQDKYGGQEIYVHWHQLKGFPVGSEVSFAVWVNEANRLKAVDLQSALNESPMKRARMS